MAEKTKAPRKVTKLEAVSCLIVLLGVLFLFTLMKVDISVAIITSTFYMVVIGLICGHSIKELLNAMFEKIADIADLTLLLMGIGFLVAALVYGGSIPTLISYLMKLISPSMCIPLAFVLTAITATCIGTSYGTAGTMGIIMISLGIALNVNMPMLAGAVIGGSHVGLFISPISDNFNTTAGLAKANTAETMKRAAYIAVPTLAICLLFYVVGGLIGGVSGAPVDINAFGAELGAIFNINPIALVPIVYVFVVSFMKLPAVIALFSGGFIAIICGALLNGFSLWKGLACTVNGFDLSTVTGLEAESVMPQVLTLCNRGGMIGMIELFVIIFSAMAMAGVMIRIGVLDVIVHSLLGNVKDPFGLALCNFVIGTVTAITTSASAISIIMPYELLSAKYEELGYSKLDCAVMSNTIASPIMSITPWTDVGIYMSGVVGVPVLAYLPYNIWGWGLGLVGVICALFRIGFKKQAAAAAP